MRTIIHDLDNTELLNFKDDDIILTSENSQYCIGCFNCWTKTPLKCVFKDKLHENGKYLLDSDELIIISRCINGCYSSKVKKVLERSISYVLPFFTIREKELHHKLRNEKRLSLKVYFYGNVNDKDKNIARKLVMANKKNFDNSNMDIYFVNKIEDLII